MQSRNSASSVRVPARGKSAGPATLAALTTTLQDFEAPYYDAKRATHEALTDLSTEIPPKKFGLMN